jgi:hypothetical protein
VIAMEVMTSADGTCASTTSNNELTLKPITSLVFLASRRECTTLEIVSLLYPQYSVGKREQQQIISLFCKELRLEEEVNDKENMNWRKID